MNDEAFARLVAEEVKGRATIEQSDYLRLPENWTRWQRSIVALLDNLNGQLAEIAESDKRDEARYRPLGNEGLKLLAESLAESENRRKKVQRFKFYVESRLDEINRMIAMGNDAVDERMKTVTFLRKAIETHKEMMDRFDLEPTAVDIALWASLDGRWEFDNIAEEDVR